jgi:hypothetical protein
MKIIFYKKAFLIVSTLCFQTFYSMENKLTNLKESKIVQKLFDKGVAQELPRR